MKGTRIGVSVNRVRYVDVYVADYCYQTNGNTETRRERTEEVQGQAISNVCAGHPFGPAL